MARKEFLAAIQNWPDHAMARQMITAGPVKEERSYIVQTIRPGESISKLALLYYGDYKKYPHIGKFNTLKNATQVQVGQKVMIPEIEGIGLADLEKRQTAYLASLESVTTEAFPPIKILPSPVPETMEHPKIEADQPRVGAMAEEKIETTASDFPPETMETVPFVRR